MNDAEIAQLIDEKIKKAMQFSTVKYGDTPTDTLQLTPKKYVNLNGTLAARPASVLAVKGQQYYATDINIPLFFDGSAWRNGVGSVIANN